MLLSPLFNRIACVLLAITLFPTAPTGALRAEPDVTPPDPDSFLETLPRDTESETEQDHKHSSTLFAHGRLLQQRQRLGDALRKYQRAWRYNPNIDLVLRDIVGISMTTNRRQEAQRYATIALNSDVIFNNPNQLGQIALMLTRANDFEGAVSAYNKLLEVRGKDNLDAAAVAIRIEIGRLSFLAQNIEESAKAFEFVKDILENPDKLQLSDTQRKQFQGRDGITYVVMGEAFMQNGQLDIAESCFNKANEIKDNPALYSLRMAHVSSRRDDNQAALDYLDDYFEVGDKNTASDAYNLLWETQQKLASKNDAARKNTVLYLTPLLENDPENIALKTVIAGHEVNLRHYAIAANLYREVLEKQLSKSGSKAFLSLFLDKNANRGPKAHRASISDLEVIWLMAKSAESTYSFENLDADQLKQITEDDDRSAELLAAADKYLQSDDGEKYQHHHLQTGKANVALAAALLCSLREDMQQAGDYFERILDLDASKSERVLESWGFQLLVHDDADQAVEIFTRAAAVEGGSRKHVINYFLAGAAVVNKDFDIATAAAKTAAEIGKGNPRLRSRYPWVLYQQKAYGDSQIEYQKILDQFDNQHGNPAIRDAMKDIRMSMSNVALQQKQIGDAIEYLEQVLDEFPDDIGALNDLGYLWADENQHLNRSLAMLLKAVAAQPENQAYRDSLGWVYYRLGDYEQAQEQIELAIEKGDGDADAVILDHLADTLLKLNQRRKAEELWQKAVKQLEDGGDKRLLNSIQEKLNAN